MNTAIRSLTLITSSVLVSAAAFAKPVTVKDWSLDDTGAICVASTTRALAGQNYRLELSYDKSGQYPVEAWVREIPATSTTQAFRINTEVAPIQNFAALPIQDAAGNVSFWQVPTDTNALISYIKRQTRLLATALTPNGAGLPATKVVDFSLRGSSDVVDALISQCAGGKALVQVDFEKSFVPAQVATMDPLKYDSVKAAQLRALYQSAITANNQKTQFQRQLTALNSQYAKQIQELSQVTGTLDQLTTKELINLQNQKATLEQRIASLDQQLAAQQSTITAKESEVSQANGVYDQAWKILAPYETEHQRLATLLQNSQSDLNKYQSQLSGIDRDVQSKSAQLNDAQSQVNSLNQQLNQLQSAISNARNDVNYTDSLYRRFDNYRERQDRIQWHPLARYCNENRTDRCNYLMSKASSFADSEVSNIQNRLSENANTAVNNVNQMIDSSNRVASQIRNYTDSVIPSLQSQIADLRNQRPGVESAASRARDEVTNRTAALQSYDQSVGYAAKKADVNAKAAVVVNLQNQLKTLEQTKSATQQARTQSVADLTVNDRKIQDVLTKIQANQGRESELTQALVPYFAEKTRLKAGINQSSALIAQNKQDFANVIAAN